MADIFELFRRIAAPKTGSGPIEWVIAGLGNPGQQYEGTRHNMGFRAMDRLAADAGVRIDRLRFRGLTAEATVAEHRVLLLKPQTYMNSSGESVAEAMNWYKLPSTQLIVIHDDISLEPGRIRVRGKGSPGGHNGIEDIIRMLGTEEFYRVKLGVGAPPNKDYDLADWVLSKISGEEVDDAVERGAEAARCIMTEGLDETMHRFNGKVSKKSGDQ